MYYVLYEKLIYMICLLCKNEGELNLERALDKDILHVRTYKLHVFTFTVTISRIRFSVMM